LSLKNCTSIFKYLSSKDLEVLPLRRTRGSRRNPCRPFCRRCSERYQRCMVRERYGRLVAATKL